MKNGLQLFGIIVFAMFTMISCEKSAILPVHEEETPIAESSDNNASATDSIKLGDHLVYPLSGLLINLVNENFESDGQQYYSYHLKLQKVYKGSVIYPNGSYGSEQLSFSVNLKFYSDQKNGPVDEKFTIENQDNILSYYKTINRKYTTDKKAIAFLHGDKLFDKTLSASEYSDYLKSQVRIKSGTFQIKKSGEKYLVSFEGETETGEKIQGNFNDTVSYYADDSFQGHENDYSLTEIPENYIQKEGKYYQLNDGYYYIFKPATYLGYFLQTVQVINWKDYYWYEYEKESSLYKWDPERITQLRKSNAVFLQFQFGNINQFQTKTYQVAPSNGIHSMGYGLGVLKNIPFSGFPNDTLLIGYYHIATDTPFTFTYDEDPNYMKNQIALKSGKLDVTRNSSEYFISGDFVDSSGEQVKVKFKAIQYPWQFEW